MKFQAIPILHLTYCRTSLRADTIHVCNDHQWKFIACQLCPAPCCDALFTSEATEKRMELVVGRGCFCPLSALTEWLGEKSGLQTEPVPQRAVDLQAGLAALIAVRTQHIQLTHLTIDL